ncbi:MAG: methenyltetrahydromethanopterin cyclohydrolase [Isosphaeraceae bacterium]|nr:methenyltetrahydromethanopterin cyclohydrolase [Isosphaeraceae bacterium]
MDLNARAGRLVEEMIGRARELRIAARPIEKGGGLVDCGAEQRGGLAAGILLARVCMADLAGVSIVPGEVAGRACSYVHVWTDHPVASCLASQYAGWAISEGKFFAMGSGPMRAASGREAIFDRIGFRESASGVIGVLETRSTPTPEVVAKIAEQCKVPPACVTLLTAPTASLAGGVQITARSVETALHKLAELGFDLGRVVAGHGWAPLPPTAKNDLAAIGRTNDSILYGARVVLDVTGDDASLEELGPRVPSAASRDHGEPFAAIFRRYDHDFYKVDPHLFSPAEVVFNNIETGRVHAYGHRDESVLERSFSGI